MLKVIKFADHSTYTRDIRTKMKILNHKGIQTTFKINQFQMFLGAKKSKCCGFVSRKHEVDIKQ
jgi:hypothetical protein